LSRVLFLAESFHPVFGGGETHIRRLGRRLVEWGTAVTVLTRRGEAGWAPEETLDDGIRVVRVPPAGPGRTGKYLMVPAVLRALAREGPRHDVLVVRGTRVLGVPGLVAARTLGLGVVMQPEINGELSGEAFTWGKAWAGGPVARAVRAVVGLRNRWLTDADAFVAMSRTIRDEMLGAGVAEQRIVLIPHGVDTQRFRPAAPAERDALRARLRLPNGVLAAYTGRLLRGKGLETLVEAFAPAAARDPRLHLALVGSGEGQALSIEEELRRQVEARGLAGRVIFTGRVDDVADHLRASDLFVFPSLFEALGISLIEAAACGLPSIGSRTGGIVDVIEDGASGRLVTPGRADELAAALQALACDPDARAALGRRGRAIALARFDERDAALRYRTLFREVSSRPPSSSPPGRAPRAGGGPPPSPASRA
jgi:glycosyltransferase involved in cell wall biosynthesis